VRAEPNEHPLDPAGGEPVAQRRPGGPGCFRRFVLRPLFWALALLALLIFLLQTFSVSTFLRERARVFLVAQLSDLLARPVTIANLELSVVPLSVSLAGVRVAGPTSADQPLLTLERLTIDAELASLREPVLTLRQVRLDRPKIHLEFRADGSNNLPRLVAGAGEAGRRRLELAIGGLTIRRGQLTLNEMSVPLDLEAQGISGRLVGVGGLDMQGQLAVSQVAVTLPAARPVNVSLEGRVVVGKDRLSVVGMRILGDHVSAQVQGGIAWLPTLDVNLRVQADTALALLEDLGYVDPAVARLVGDVRVDGGLVWKPEAWGFRARVSSPEADLAGYRLSQVAGVVAGDAFAINLDLERAGYRGGDVHGAVAVGLDASGERPDGIPITADLQVSGVGLAGAFADIGVPIAGVDGAVAGRLRYTLGHRAPLRGEGDAELTIARVTGPAVSLGGPVRLTARQGRLTLGTPEAPIELASPLQSLSLNGGIDLQPFAGRLAFDLATEDVAEVMRAVPGAEADPETGEAAAWVPRSGRGTASGTLALGTPGAPGSETTLDLALDLSEVTAPGLVADELSGSFHLDGDGLRDLRLDLSTRSPGAALLVTGSVPFAADDPTFAVGVDAAGWPLASARAWLPFALPVDGRFDGSVALRGPLSNLAGSVAGRVRVAAARLVSAEAQGEMPGGAPGAGLGDLELRLTFDPQRVDVAAARLTLPAGRLEAHGTVDLTVADLGLDFDVRGRSLALAGLTAGGLGGTVDLSAQVGGTLATPAVDADLTASGLTLGGRPLGTGTGQTQLHWRDDVASLTGAIGGLLRLDGGGRLSTTAADLELAVELPDLAGVLAAAGAAELPLGGHASGQLAVSGPFTGPALPGITLTLPEVALVNNGVALASREPVVLALTAAGEPGQGLAIDVRSLYLGVVGRDDEVFASGSIGLAAPYPLDLKVQGTFDAAMLRPMVPSGVQLSGTVDILATVGGEMARPALNGEAQLHGGRLLTDLLPNAIDQLTATVLFYPDELVLDHLTGRFAGGTVEGGGNLTLPPLAAPDAAPELTFQLALADVSLRYPEGWLLHGEARLAFQQSAATGRQLRGAVTLDRAFYLRDLPVELGQLLPRLLQRSRVEVEESDELLAGTTLNVLLDLRGATAGEGSAGDASARYPLRIRNNVADLRGSGQLTVGGTLARPVVFGSLDFEQGGRLRYADNDYLVERALLTFANPYRLDPIVDLVATTSVRDYDVTLALAGSLDRLKIDLTSDPPLPDLDVLALVATGQPLSGGGQYIAPVPGTPGETLDAGALLANQAARLVSSRVGTLFGLDKFRIDPSTGANGGLSSGRVTVGKRLSRDVYATYSYDPATSEQQVLEVEWRVSPEWSLYLTQNGNGSYAVDARWERAF
jgi:translocation and assembly module TamB